MAAVRKRVESVGQVENEDEIREWLAWAEEYIEAYDPLNDLGSVPFEVKTKI